jgi:hypothetical protein
VLFCVMCVIYLLCLIVAPLSPDAGHGSREVACFLFARSEAVTVGSNPTQGMDV